MIRDTRDFSNAIKGSYDWWKTRHEIPHEIHGILDRYLYIILAEIYDIGTSSYGRLEANIYDWFQWVFLEL